MRTLFLAFFFLMTAAACNKPEPNPEKQDQIYLDLLTEQGNAEKMRTEAEKELEENKKALDAVVPQTGQIHYARKRVNEAQSKVDKLTQQIKYWTLRSESRRDYVRRKSLEAFNKGQKWDDPKEYQEYLTQKRMYQARREWSGRERRENFLEEEAKAKKGAGGEGGKEGEAPKEGGHH